MGETVAITKFLCKRCSHEWLPRNPTKEPKRCPRCQVAFRSPQNAEKDLFEVRQIKGKIQ